MLCSTSLSLSNCIFLWNASHAGGPSRSSLPTQAGAWVCEALWCWVLVENSLSSDIDSTVTNRLKQNVAVGLSQVVERCAPPLYAMEDIVAGRSGA